MKEFDDTSIVIFGGLNNKRSKKKKDSKPLECHNIEPIKNGYRLHGIVADINSSTQDWNNA